MIELLGSESDPALAIVRAALRRAVTAGQIDTTGTGASRIVVLVNPTDRHTARLASLLRESGKAIVFGRPSPAIAALCGLKIRGDVPAEWLAASECDPALPHEATRSDAAVAWSTHPLFESVPFKVRPFLRFDFANEWNNLGFGRIRADGGAWSIAADVEPGGAEVLAVAEADGLSTIPFVALRDTDSGAVLWWNRAVGPVDSGEWAVVEDFIANWRHADMPTVPVVSEIPFGYDAAVTMRLDCDEDIASARPLFDLYRSRGLPFSLAVRTAQDDGGGRGAALLRDVFASGGSVLSHSVTHAPNWGGSEDACYLEARGSIDWLEERVPGLRVRYAVSPFHQNPPYVSRGLNRAGLDGFVGGIIANDPEALVARGGVLPDDDTGTVTHSQQCMLHGDCILPGSDGLAIIKQAFWVATASRAIFGFLDHPFSARYQYGWTSEEERVARHAEFLNHISEQMTGKSVLWLNEDQCLDWIGSKSRLLLRPARDGFTAEGLRPAAHRFAVRWRGDVLPLDAVAHG